MATIQEMLDTSPFAEKTELELLVLQYLDTISNSGTTIFRNDLGIMLNLAYSKEIFGKDPQPSYDAINDLFYLLQLCINIYWDRNNEYLTSGTYRGASYYDEIYNFACIRKTMACKGYDIMPLLTIFNLDYTKADLTDGIMFMYLDPQNGETPEFIIQ